MLEVVGKIGTAPVPQITNEVPKLNMGVTRGVTITNIVVETPHCPPLGVNV